MIRKKILATTLATLSVVSMSLPAMAIRTTDVSQENHEGCSRLQPSNSISDDFEVIEKNSKDVQLFNEETVKINKEDEDKNAFVNISVDGNQKEAIQDSIRSTEYQTIKNQVKSCKKSVSNTINSYNKWDGGVNSTAIDSITGVVSGTYKTVKNTLSIGKTAISHPVESAKYALNNKEHIKQGVSTLYKWGKFAYNWYNGK